MRDLTDKWCLITGASSGIGAEFARQLAAAGGNVVLVARREDRLRAVAEEIRQKHGREAHVVVLDLATDGAATELHGQLAALGVTVDVLVNNAGFGEYGEFASLDPQRIESMLALNVVCLTLLTRLYLPEMLARRSGAIINVASTAAFQPVPYLSLYAATKAFVLHFSEGLWAETRKQGVVIQALCPGFTRTEFFDRAHLPKSVAITETTAEAVVADSLRALRKGKPSTIPGLLNGLVAFSNRLAPRRLASSVAAKMFHPKRHGAAS